MVPHIVRGDHRPRHALDPAVRGGPVAGAAARRRRDRTVRSPGPPNSRSASSPRSSAARSSSSWSGAERWPSCEKRRADAHAHPPKRSDLAGAGRRPAHPRRAVAPRRPAGRAWSAPAAAARLAAGVVALVGTGDYAIAPADVLRTLAGHGTAGQDFVIRELRLPRVLVALLVGAALGMAGAAFQTVSRNPLGSPDVIGFGQGSAAGRCSSSWCCYGSSVEVVRRAPSPAGCSPARRLPAGLEARRARLPAGARRHRRLRGALRRQQLPAGQGDFVDAARAVIWITGSLDGRDWDQVWPLLGACALLMPRAARAGRALRITEMGDDAAHALGVRVERVRLTTVLPPYCSPRPRPPRQDPSPSSRSPRRSSPAGSPARPASACCRPR